MLHPNLNAVGSLQYPARKSTRKHLGFTHHNRMNIAQEQQ